MIARPPKIMLPWLPRDLTAFPRPQVPFARGGEPMRRRLRHPLTVLFILLSLATLAAPVRAEQSRAPGGAAAPRGAGVRPARAVPPGKGGGRPPRQGAANRHAWAEYYDPDQGWVSVESSGRVRLTETAAISPLQSGVG